MSAHAYTEDQLVEQPASGLCAELGWAVAGPPPNAGVAGEPRDAGWLGRETKGEAVLVSRLRAALERLNSALPPEAITAAMDELTRDRSAMSLEAANREVYRLLKEGIPVSVMERDSTPPDTRSSGRESAPSKAGRDRSRLTSAATGQKAGGQTTVRVWVIDWEQPANDDFLLVSQFSVTGALYTCRPDLVGFVNGLPLVVIELKKPGAPARAAFDENLMHGAERKNDEWRRQKLRNSHPARQLTPALPPFEAEMDSAFVIRTSPFGLSWSLEVMLRGTCDRARLLDLVENFTLFSEHKAALVKIIGQNHQFLGVNNAIAARFQIHRSSGRESALTPPLASREVSRLTSAATGKGEQRLGLPSGASNPNGLGVFWHTQGSGKSFSMVFFAQKVLRKVGSSGKCVPGFMKSEQF